MATTETAAVTRLAVAAPVTPQADANTTVSPTETTSRASWTTNSGTTRRVAVSDRIGPTPQDRTTIEIAKIRALAAYATKSGHRAPS